jgi:hypothetical protein
MLERELEASSESFHTGTKFTFGQRRKLVEHRLDECRVDDLDENGEHEAGNRCQLFRSRLRKSQGTYKNAIK